MDGEVGPGLAVDSRRIRIRLGWMGDGLARDWRHIDTGLPLDDGHGWWSSIGPWTDIGSTLDWHHICKGLTLDWHRIEIALALDGHRIGTGCRPRA